MYVRELEIVGNNKGLEIFLGCLLKVETDLRVEPIVFFKVNPCKIKVFVCLGQPLHDDPGISHKAPCPLCIFFL